MAAVSVSTDNADASRYFRLPSGVAAQPIKAAYKNSSQ